MVPSPADITRIQDAIREARLDGWLFYDFHNRDPVGLRVLGLDESRLSTRRWAYFVPAEGEPARLVHRIESAFLDALPGIKRVYAAWQEFEAGMKSLVTGARKVAMQYSPGGAVPTVSLVDAGTIELVKGYGVEVVSSADLIARFEAVQPAEILQDHKATGAKIHAILDETFREMGRRLERGDPWSEFAIQQRLVSGFEAESLTCEGHAPIVAFNGHAGDPHFEPFEEGSDELRQGDFVLIDLWARNAARSDSIYFDVTWTAFAGSEVPERYTKIFDVVRDARDSVVELLEQRFSSGHEVRGWELDKKARDVISAAGYAESFIHRTGHNISRDLHGNGANLDNLETRDDRRILPGTCFSVEPGIYFDDFGVRSEINVVVTHEGRVEVTGPAQTEIVTLMS